MIFGSEIEREPGTVVVDSVADTHGFIHPPMPVYIVRPATHEE